MESSAADTRELERRAVRVSRHAASAGKIVAAGFGSPASLPVEFIYTPGKS
jgi:hypothetical protein